MVNKVRKPVKKNSIAPGEAREKLDELIPKIYDASTVAKVAEKKRKEYQADILPLMKLLGDSQIIVQHDDMDIQATLVEPEDKPQLDSESFLKSLTAAQKKAVTKTVVDVALLENAIARGVVSLDQVSQHSPMKPGSSPYVKVTATKSEPR